MVTRRGFIQLCATFLAALKTTAPAIADREVTPYPRVRLVDELGAGISPVQLETDTGYLFHYPHIATPCFLLRLHRPATETAALVTEEGAPYRWQGGVGPDRSVVAYSAICAHKMTHPARSVSFINYRPEPVTFRNKEEETTRRAEIIYCCSERSVYDAARGARVLGGPAPQPLAAVRLEHDTDQDALYATGVYGGELFDRFFSEFAVRLSLEFKTTDIQRLVSGTATVVPVAEYCRNQVFC